MRNKIDLALRRAELALTPKLLRQILVFRRRAKPRSNGSDDDAVRALYIDMSVISQHDARTGIQRVVRALALELCRSAPPRWYVETVAGRRQHGYRAVAWPKPAEGVSATSIQASAGDAFLGLDFSLFAVRRHRRQLSRFRRNGGKIWFMVYDLLPVERPEWFAPANVVRYKAWLDTIAGLADGFFCISDQTERDLRSMLRERYNLIEGFETVVLPMGHALKESNVQQKDKPSAPQNNRLEVVAGNVMMVGTIEPRKGHSDVIDAYEELWRQGGRQRLILVGRPGWNVATLLGRIKTHPELGEKLFWFDDVEDDELDQLYSVCCGIVSASYGEGFGLPVIEALGHGKPVLARDLPIFRAHHDHGVSYFDANASASELASTLTTWLSRVAEGTVRVHLPAGSWTNAARVVLHALNR